MLYSRTLARRRAADAMVVPNRTRCWRVPVLSETTINILEIHPERIKPRDIDRVADIIKSGAVVVVPSDSGYALLCRLDDKAAADKIRHIRELDRDHPFTILCADLTDLGRYARVDNVQYRLLKTLFPGAYTCILPASRDAPRAERQAQNHRHPRTRSPHHAGAARRARRSVDGRIAL